MAKIMFPPEFLDNVAEYYKTHTELETSLNFNISKKIVERIVRNAGVPKHKPFTKRFIGEKEKQFILDNYKLLSDTAIAKNLHIHTPRLFDLYNELGLTKKTHQENVLLGQKLQQQTCLEKYGVPFAVQNEQVIAKFTASNRKTRALYGEQIKQKTRETCLKKYGCEYALQSKIVKEKGKQTCLEKYGVDSIMKTPEFIQNSRRYLKEHRDEILRKRRETSLIKYGCEYPTQNTEVKEKVKETCLKKYGGWYSQTEERNQRLRNNKDEIRKKYEKTCLEKYGNKNYLDTDDFKSKLYVTKKKNKSFNSSKIEIEFKQKLISMFGEEDIFYQYKDERYPFACDFYIKSLDLFIEINIHWSHGAMPFKKNDPQCVAKLKLWESKIEKSNYYKLSIITWTQRDVKKLKIAKHNKLKYFVIYTYEEVEPYLKKIKKLKEKHDKSL